MVEQKNIKLTIEYDGTEYAGWQYQPNVPTIQGKLFQAIRKLTSQDVIMYAVGRTDAGVHAEKQVANFKIKHNLPAEKYRDGLNFYLPDDILISYAEEVAPDFNARYDAVYRCYRYAIGRKRSAQYRRMRWEIGFDLDLGKMEKAADYIAGSHDFTTFCVVSSQKENNRCLVYRSRWRSHGDVLCYDITADRFLHNMIRSLVGLMTELGRSGITMKQFKEIFHSGDHTAIRKVAPARGLCLVAVGY